MNKMHSIMEMLNNIFHNKLKKDIAWTLGSFSILAMSGVIINIMVAWLRDVSTLGVFNLAYAIYIIASQIAVCGLHYSVMRHSALYESSPDTRQKLMHTASIMSLMLGFLVAILVYIFSPLLGALFHSPAAAKAISCSALGLTLFPLNKVLLAYLNGLREMKIFSLLQSLRYTIVMVWVTFMSASTLPIEYITYGFFVAEFITTCIALGYMYWKKLFMVNQWSFSVRWAKLHFSFGAKSLLAGMFVELNSRVDVLLIGMYLTESQVGIYSFLAMLVDGLYHVLAMVRINFNPVLVGAVRDNKFKEIQNLLFASLKYIYPITLLLSLCIMFSFWFFSNFILPEKGLQEGLAALCILCTCLTCISAFIPFDNLLLASGHPGYQTSQHLAVVFSNILLNVMLIPIFGINGAAFATGMSYFIGIMVLAILTHYLLKWKILALFKRDAGKEMTVAIQPS